MTVYQVRLEIGTQSASPRPSRCAATPTPSLGRDGLGQLGRHVRLGADVMTALTERVPPPVALDVRQRALAAVGLFRPRLVIAAPALWLTVFFLVPLAGGRRHFAASQGSSASRPISDLLKADGRRCDPDPQLRATSPICAATRSTSTPTSPRSGSPRLDGFALLIGYPMAYAIARAPDRWRNILLMLVILPFWTRSCCASMRCSGFMRGEGRHQQRPRAVRHRQPLVMMQTDFAVYVGIVYSYLPFFILPLYTNLVKLEAPARGLGRSRRAAVAHLPLGHAAAVDARRHRRRHAGVHSGDRRVRHPLAARRARTRR